MDVDSAPQEPQPEEPLETIESKLLETAEWSRNPDIDGAAAWNALFAYQSILIEAGKPIDADESYALGGFQSYAQFQKTMGDHAVEEAQRLYDIALDKLGRDDNAPSFVPTVDTMDQLPYLDMKAALEWLKKSGRPLLADATYEEIGSTRADFFEEMQLAHITAARFKIGNAATWQGDPETGIALVESAFENNFSPLGLNVNDPDIADYIALDSATIRAIHANHVERKFRREMEIVSGFRRFGQTAMPEYHDAVLTAAKTLEGSEALREDDKIYTSIGFSREAFEAEIHSCAEHKLARLLSDLTVGDVTGKFLDDTRQTISEIRELFDFVNAPDGTPLDYVGEDYWCANILQQFGFRSYTHLVEQLAILSARAVISNTLHDSNMKPLEIHDALSEAVSMLKDVRYPVNDTAALDAIDIDRKTLTKSYVAATYPAVIRNWSILRSNTIETQSKLNFIETLRDAQSRLREAGTEEKLPFAADALDKQEEQVSLRRAAEIIADYLVALDRPNSYGKLRGAFEILDNLEAELLNPDIHGPMGMNHTFAAYIDDRMGMMELADVWLDAQDESLDLTERFEAVTSFAKQMETLDDGQVEVLTRYLGLDNPPAVGRLSEEIARRLYPEMMDMFAEYGDDPVKGYEYLSIAAECLKAINPKALEDEKIFREITGKIGCRVFLRQLESLRLRTESINRPLTRIFNAEGTGLNGMAEAFKPENRGRKAYDLIEATARELRHKGLSITDPALLQKFDMTPAQLTEFLDEQALIVAREHADKARDSKGFVLTLETAQDHPFRHFRHALSCLSRHSQGTVLNDENWQKLGFASRIDFMDQWREALLDATGQMEKLAASPQGMQMGPFGFLRLLREIREANRALGIETKEDIPNFADLEHTTNHGGAIETTQRAIHRMAYAACQQVLREKSPPGAKFKKMSFVYDFAQEMRTMTWEAGGKIGNTNEAYDGLIQQRIEGAINAFVKHKGDPGRAVRLAYALKDMATRYQLREDHWFQYLFVGMNYRDFDAFCDYAALQRIRQLVERTKETMAGLKDDGQLSPTAHLFMLRDMIRIENLAGEEGLLTERRRNDIMEELGIDPEWHRLQMAISAQFAIPQMLREAEDPTLEDTERWSLIEEARGVLKQIGSARTRHIEINKPWLGRLRTHTVLRMTALNLVEDMLRIETDTLSRHTLNAANVLGLLKTYFHDEPASRKMGLKEDEIARLIEQEKCLPAYTLARNLYEVPEANATAQYVVITQLYEAFGYAELDPHNPEHLQRIAIKKPLEFMARLDAMTLGVLKAACEDLPKLEGRPSKQVESLNLILRFIEATDIESRATKDDLQKFGILTHDEVVKALTRTVPKMHRAATKENGAGMAARPAMI